MSGLQVFKEERIIHRRIHIFTFSCGQHAHHIIMLLGQMPVFGKAHLSVILRKPTVLHGGDTHLRQVSIVLLLLVQIDRLLWRMTLGPRSYLNGVVSITVVQDAISFVSVLV